MFEIRLGVLTQTSGFCKQMILTPLPSGLTRHLNGVKDAPLRNMLDRQLS